MIGGHLIKAWSKGQSLIALSSAESELYACVKAVSEGLGIMSIYKDIEQQKHEFRQDVVSVGSWRHKMCENI